MILNDFSDVNQKAVSIYFCLKCFIFKEIFWLFCGVGSLGEKDNIAPVRLAFLEGQDRTLMGNVHYFFFLVILIYW